MKYILTLFLSILVSCASIQTEPNGKYNNIHKEFDPYVSDFIKHSKGKINEVDLWNVSMGFGEFSMFDSRVGVCYTYPFYSHIGINKRWWDNNKSKIEREELIFHELGHCVLYRNHTKPTSSYGAWGNIERWLFNVGLFEEKPLLSDGCPSSYMHPFIFSSECMLKHREYYIEELFGRVKTGDLSMERQCKEPIIKNYTKEWTERDKKSYNRAIYVCKVEYKSCLRLFTKKATRTYTVRCNTGHTLENFI